MTLSVATLTRLVPIVGLVCLTAAPTTTKAQELFDRDFSFEIFEPLPSPGINLLNLATAEVLGHLRPSVGLVFHFQNDPLLLVDVDDPSRVEQRIVEHVLKGEFSAAVGLFDILDIGFVMPLVLHQRASELLLEADPPRDFSTFTTADLRVVTKLRLVDNERASGFGLAVLGTLHLPTGDASTYQSEGVVRFEPRLVIDYRHASGFLLTTNLGYMPRSRRELLNFVNTDALRFGVGVHVPLVGRSLGLFALGHGALGLEGGSGPVDNSATAVEALGGLQVRFDDFWVANLGAGGGVVGGVGSPDVRVIASVGYTPVRNRTDSDGDGIIDAIDQCPNEPEDFDGFEDADGCPDPDNDGDGIPDVRDGPVDASGFGSCRDQPEDFDGFEDADGCPDLDNDGDGIPDVRDGPVDAIGFGSCRNDPEDFDGFEDADGCPDPDNDGDGLCDPWVSEKGLQAKYEAVCKGVDKCPDEPETFNDFEDDDGCPDVKPMAVLKDTGIEILEKIFFDFDKATLQPQSFPVLDTVVEILNDNPQVTLIRVEGHTDTVGTRAYNLDLSTRRAKTVVDYLVRQGIASKRVFGRGYGFDYPLDTNETQEGRDRNRRVEFNILEIDGKPIANPVIRTRTKARSTP